MKYEIPAMLENGCGALVNTASVDGLRMAPGFGAYGPSKAAVVTVSRTAVWQITAESAADYIASDIPFSRIVYFTVCVNGDTL